MTQAVINENNFTIKLYDDNQELDCCGFERHITKVRMFLTHDGNVSEIEGVEKIYWFGFEEEWFLRKSSAIACVRKNKKYRMSDIKHFLCFWIVCPEDWRCIKKKKFSASYVGFKILDYRG
jgi:hypothetical protein